MSGMDELIGHNCRVVFNLPAHEWPYPGYPAWVQVKAVDMPMIKLGPRAYTTDGKWINTSLIATIESVE